MEDNLDQAIFEEKLRVAQMETADLSLEELETQDTEYLAQYEGLLLTRGYTNEL